MFELSISHGNSIESIRTVTLSDMETLAQPSDARRYPEADGPLGKKHIPKHLFQIVVTTVVALKKAAWCAGLVIG